MCACCTDVLFTNRVNNLYKVFFRNVQRAVFYFSLSKCFGCSWKLCFAVQVTGDFNENSWRIKTKTFADTPLLFLHHHHSSTHCETITFCLIA